MLQRQDVTGTSVGVTEPTENVIKTAEAEYPYLFDEKKVRKDYLNSVNKEIESAVISIRNGDIDSVPDVIDVVELNEKTGTALTANTTIL